MPVLIFPWYTQLLSRPATLSRLREPPNLQSTPNWGIVNRRQSTDQKASDKRGNHAANPLQTRQLVPYQ